jgi:hypothetical protein
VSFSDKNHVLLLEQYSPTVLFQGSRSGIDFRIQPFDFASTVNAPIVFVHLSPFVPTYGMDSILTNATHHDIFGRSGLYVAQTDATFGVSNIDRVDGSGIGVYVAFAGQFFFIFFLETFVDENMFLC